MRILVAFIAAAGTLGAEVRQPSQIEGLPTRVAFGSCCKEDKPHPILKAVVGKKPELFVYLGDNIYGDTEDMKVLAAKYARLGAKPEFQELRRKSAVVATWDDHDYGANDAGREYPRKSESKEVFLDFWAEPEGTARRGRPGIYTHYTFTEGERTMQVILLDGRTFRDPLLTHNKDPRFKNDYRPDPDPDKTFLGEDQWRWLEERLREPADLRIIGTSIQFGHEYNGWESWTNLPAEQEKMIRLIKSTRAHGVIFISGDVHWGEISKREVAGGYPLYDVTSSGLTETWPTIEENKFRVGAPYREPNFGMIAIDWEAADPVVHLQIHGVDGTRHGHASVKLSELSFPD